ncbi:MAG: hypothetical protein ACPGOY_00070 [Rhodospirillaceae bacterium]
MIEGVFLISMLIGMVGALAFAVLYCLFGLHDWLTIRSIERWVKKQNKENAKVRKLIAPILEHEDLIDKTLRLREEVRLNSIKNSEITKEIDELLEKYPVSEEYEPKLKTKK